MKDFRSLKVWHKAAALTDTIYPLIAAFPPCERNALADQLRRAAQSMELNIDESCGAESDSANARPLRIAIKSACEVEGAVNISCRRNYGPEDLRTKANGLVIEVKKMLCAYLRKIEERSPKRRRS
jgi:four helix bundle protein